jgi:hypothetical protein
MILGDDNVIIGSDLITAYEKMCKSLGIEMSSSKTIKTKGEGFEFCKKIFRKGVNITPISWTILQLKDPILRHVELTRTLLYQYPIDIIDNYTKVLLTGNAVVDMNVISLYNEIMNSQRVGGQYDVPTHILEITRKARVLLHIQRLQNVINQIQHLEAVRLRSLRAQLRGLGKKKFRGLVSSATEV